LDLNDCKMTVNGSTGMLITTTPQALAITDAKSVASLDTLDSMKLLQGDDRHFTRPVYMLIPYSARTKVSLQAKSTFNEAKFHPNVSGFVNPGRLN
jgi:hypothetical protein